MNVLRNFILDEVYMIIKSVMLGTISIPTKKFVEFIKGSNVLTKFLEIESPVNGNNDDVKFLSIKQNVRIMEPNDPRIVEKGRKFLYTHAMTEIQRNSLLDFFKRNHLTVDFEVDPSNWITATKSEEELQEGERQ